MESVRTIPRGIGERNARRIAAALLLALSLLLVACGGDKGSSAKPAGETTAGAAKGTPLRIGVLDAQNAKVSVGDERAPVVLDAWAKAVNADGGVAGHPVEFVVKDTKGDPSTATKVAGELASDKTISAVLAFDTFTEGVFAPVITKAGLPVVGGMGASPVVWGKLPNWLPVVTTFPASINSWPVAAQAAGAKKPILAVCAEYPTCAAIAPIAQSATEKLGMTYGGTVKLSLSAPDHTAACLSIADKGADFVMLGLDAASSAKFIGECTTQKYEGGWGIIQNSVDQGILKANDPGVPVSLMLSSFAWWDDSAPVAAYRDMMEAQGVSESDWGSLQGTAAYATMELFKQTLEANASSLPDDPTAKDVIAAYGTIKDETLDGLLPQPITFTPGKPEPLVNCYWLGTFEHGDFTGAALDQPTCDPAKLSS